MDGFQRAVDLVHDRSRELAGDDKLLIWRRISWISCSAFSRLAGAIHASPLIESLGGCHSWASYSEGSTSAGQFLLRHGRIGREASPQCQVLNIGWHGIGKRWPAKQIAHKILRMRLRRWSGGCGRLRRVPLAAGRSGFQSMQASVMLCPWTSGCAGDELLRAGDEVALNHDADDVAISGGNLCGDVAADERAGGCGPYCCWRGCSRS